jgi:hypothetical protein
MNPKQPIILLLFMASLALAADFSVKERIPLSATEELVIEHPSTFHYDMTQDPDDRFETAARLRMAGTNGFVSLSLKIFASRDEEGKLAGRRDVELLLQKMGAPYVDHSVEQSNVPRPLKLKEGIGAYTVFTDADLVGVTSLRPGQFRNLTFGVARIGKNVFTIRGYSNEKAGLIYKAMLGVLEGLRVEKKKSQAAP